MKDYLFKILWVFTYTKNTVQWISLKTNNILIKSMEKNNIILINNFVVEDTTKQQKVVDMLEDPARQILDKHDGFISTRIHKSLDGTKVMSYVQWENKESFEKMLNDPRAIIYMNDIATMAKVDRILYELVYTEEKNIEQ